MRNGHQLVEFGEVGTVIAGQHIEANLYTRSEHGSPYLTGPDDFGISEPTVSKWTLHPKVFAESGDVLLTVKGAGVGKSNLAVNAAIGRQLMALRPNQKKLDRRFLFRVLQANELALSRLGQGATVPGIPKPAIERFKFPLPPLSEQKRIAEILDKADAIRHKCKEALKGFELLRTALFDRMFASRFSTSEWTTLDEYLVELRYGTSNKSSNRGYLTLRIPNIIRGIIDLNDLKTVSVSEGELEKLRLTDGDMLFVRTNGNPDYVGRCAVFSRDHFVDHGITPDNVIYASYLIRGRLDMHRLRPAFLQAFLQTPLGRKDVRDKCRTSAGQYNINTKGIGSLRVPRIKSDDQLTFEKRLASLRPAFQNLTLAYEDADQLFDALVQRAFKGEL